MQAKLVTGTKTSFPLGISISPVLNWSGFFQKQSDSASTLSAVSSSKSALKISVLFASIAKVLALHSPMSTEKLNYTVMITQIVSPKKFPLTIDILHLDSYIPDSFVDVILTEMSVSQEGSKHSAYTLSDRLNWTPEQNLRIPPDDHRSGPEF